MIRRASVLLSFVGELLVTFGLLLSLFVVWQLWWTDVTASKAHQEVLSNLSWAYTPTPSSTPSTTPSSTPSSTAPDTPPPVMDPPAFASTFATLRVPRWGDYVEPISEGTAKHQVLDKLGIGHYEGTALPGEVGNFAVAGHRTTYGKPFHRIAELQVGDPLVVQTAQGWYVYKVSQTLIVKPTDVWVISPTGTKEGGDPTERIMTMTSCHPMYSARERYVVHAVFEYWSPPDQVPVEVGG